MPDKKDETKQSVANYGIQADTVQADVMAVGAGAQAIQHNYAQAKPQEDELAVLVQQLNEALATLSQENADDAEVVAALTDELIENSEKEKPNRKLLEIKGEGLKQAAQNLAEVMPVVLTIAGQIVAHILGMR